MPDADAEPVKWKSDKGAVLDGAVVGEGSTFVVLLHQTDRIGFCGFWAYANRLAEKGMRAVLVDLCSHGKSDCSEDDDFRARPTEQVRLPVEWSRDKGAERVVLVGASMGGSIALGSAQELQVDAVVDLSGPVEWLGVPSAVEAAPELTVPTLVIASSLDPSTDTAVLKRAVAAMPAEPKRFVEAADGSHGWDLLEKYSGMDKGWTETSDLVAQWAAEAGSALP